MPPNLVLKSGSRLTGMNLPWRNQGEYPLDLSMWLRRRAQRPSNAVINAHELGGASLDANPACYRRRWQPAKVKTQELLVAQVGSRRDEQESKGKGKDS